MSRKSQISPESRSPKLYDVQETFLKAGSYLRNWGGLTQRTYRQAMQSFKADAPFLGEDGIPAKSSLDGWVIAMKERGLSPGGINMYARAVNSYLTWLHEEGKTPSRLRIKLLPNPPKPLTTFSDSEVKRLLHGTTTCQNHKRSKTLVTLLLDTGLRIGEAVGLEQQNVDFDDLMVRIVGKGNRERIVPISPECRKALFRFSSDSKNRYVFGTIFTAHLREDSSPTLRDSEPDGPLGSPARLSPRPKVPACTRDSLRRSHRGVRDRDLAEDRLEDFQRHPIHMKCFFANARPEPDFKYFSNAIALDSLLNSRDTTRFHGRSSRVYVELPALCTAILAATSVDRPV